MKTDDKPLFAASIATPEVLFAVLDFLSEDDEVVGVEIHKADGMQMRAIDKSQVSFLEIAIPVHPLFVSFSCAQDFLKIWLKPKLLIKALKAGKATCKHLERLHLCIPHPGDKLLLSMEGVAGLGVQQRTKHTFTLLEPQGVKIGAGDTSEATVDGQDFAFSAQAMVSKPQLLTDAIAQLKAAGCEELCMQLSRTCLRMASTQSASNMSEVEICLRPSELEHVKGLQIAAEDGAECSATFTFRHFKRVAQLCSNSSAVLLQLGEDTPLSIVAMLKGTHKASGTCRLFLAPLLQSESDEEDTDTMH